MKHYQRQESADHPPKKKKRRSAGQRRFIRIAVTLGLILLLLIPTYFAIGSYLYVKNKPQQITETYYTSLTATGPNGATFFASSSTEKELFDCFVAMLEDPNPVSVVKPANTAVYTVNFQTNTGEESYRFYFSHLDGTVYFQNAAGQIYHVTNNRGNLFLNSHFAYEIYPQAVLPSLQAASTDTILPYEANWQYRTSNGEFLQLKSAATEPHTKVYGIADNFVSFLFKNPQSAAPFVPDDCHLIITQNGVEIFNAPIRTDDLSVPLNLPPLTGNELFVIRAEYYQKSDVPYYGSLTYRFAMTSTEPAVFAIANQAHATEGSFYLFTAQNVDRLDQLLFSTGSLSEESVFYPIVFKRNKTVYAMIPTDVLGADGSLIVRYGSKMEQFHLSCLPTAKKDVTTLFSESIPSLQALLNEKGADSTTADTGSIYTPNGTFHKPLGTLIASFGDTVTKTGNTTSLPFELYRTSGDALAPAYGVIKEVGTHDALGGYVIIDHGCGVYSWLCGLSQTYKTAGQTVAINDPVGRIGNDGIGGDGGDTLLLMTTIGKTAVDPAYLRSFHFQFGK